MPASTQRSSRPPRLMSPRPTNAGGNTRRSPKIGCRTSTYFPDAMLPSRTTSHSGPTASRSALAPCSSGPRYAAFARSIDTAAKASSDFRVIGVSADRNPAFGVITSTPLPATGSDGSGGLANRRAYASLPRKYRPLTKLNTSPSEVPSTERSCRARANCATGDITIRARTPLQLAGDRRNTRPRSTWRREAARDGLVFLGTSAEETGNQIACPAKKEKRHCRDHHQQRHAHGDERPVAGGRFVLLVRVALEEGHVAVVCLPREVEQIADDRNEARQHVDRHIEDHPQLDDARDAQVPRLENDPESEQR